MNLVNGREYPLWNGFIERKDEWIGGILHDLDDCEPTQIVDIELLPNGDTSAFFQVKGEDYDCGFDVGHGGIMAEHVENGLMLNRVYGGPFSITRK